MEGLLLLPNSKNYVGVCVCARTRARACVCTLQWKEKSACKLLLNSNNDLFITATPWKDDFKQIRFITHFMPLFTLLSRIRSLSK